MVFCDICDKENCELAEHRKKLKNCAKRHIRPLYVNFGGDIFLFCVWFWVWHSSVQPLFISFSLTWMASTIFCLRGAHRPRPQWRWYFWPIRSLENVTWQTEWQKEWQTEWHFDSMTTNALRAAAVKINNFVKNSRISFNAKLPQFLSFFCHSFHLFLTLFHHFYILKHLLSFC